MSDKLYLITQAQLDMLARALITGEGEDPLASTATWAEINAKAARPHKEGQIIAKTLTELTAEDLKGATKIGKYAFYQCVGLESVVIPDSVTGIGFQAFEGCTSLTSVAMGNGVKGIDAWAFEKCESLTSVIIPDSVLNINSRAFGNCRSLTNVKIGNGVTIIDSEVFYNCSSLTGVTIGNSVESIGYMAFAGCSNLMSITIPNSVTNIEGEALSIGTSTNLATITFLSTVPPTISASTFDTSRLNKIIVPAETREAYIGATNWADFADYIEEE